MEDRKASDLMHEALNIALKNAGLQLTQLDGLIAVPSLAEPRFMEAHYIGNCYNCYTWHMCYVTCISHKNWPFTAQECCRQNN